MQRLIILGAGQFGRACAALINRAHYELYAFADNNPALTGASAMGIPVLPVAQALAGAPDAAVIGVRGEKRAAALRAQVRSLGFTGKLYDFDALSTLFDIRGAVLTRLAPRLNGLLGDIAELGVFQGHTARHLSALFPDRTLHLFDTFSGFDSRDIAKEPPGSAQAGDFSDTSISAVLSLLPYPEKAAIHAGFFPETVSELPPDCRFCLVSLDADLYAPTLAGLMYFYPRLLGGGAIVLHDYLSSRFPGVRQAVDEFERENGPLSLVPLADAHGTAVILKP